MTTGAIELSTDAVLLWTVVGAAVLLVLAVVLIALWAVRRRRRGRAAATNPTANAPAPSISAREPGIDPEPPNVPPEPPEEATAPSSMATSGEWHSFEEGGPIEADLLSPQGREDAFGGILRWLVAETDADAAAYLEVAPQGREQLLVEPRGLDPATLGDLAREAREALLSNGGGELDDGESVTARWLGVGGSKILLLRGASPIASAEPLRFARFIVEWLAAAHRGMEGRELEERVRTIPGVAFAEIASGGRLRVLLADRGETQETRPAVEQVVAGTGVMIDWIGEGRRGPEERARLLHVALTTDIQGRPSADVRLAWRGEELRGRGHAETTVLGHHLATARACLDAVKPVIHGDVDVEHLYVTQPPMDQELVVVTVRIGQERYAGAALSRDGEDDPVGARAVLDALNRRLPRLAGQSGRI